MNPRTGEIAKMTDGLEAGWVALTHDEAHRLRKLKPSDRPAALKTMRRSKKAKRRMPG
jgi:hypothetical protein